MGGRGGGGQIGKLGAGERGTTGRGVAEFFPIDTTPRAD